MPQNSPRGRTNTKNGCTVSKLPSVKFWSAWHSWRISRSASGRSSRGIWAVGHRKWLQMLNPALMPSLLVINLRCVVTSGWCPGGARRRKQVTKNDPDPAGVVANDTRDPSNHPVDAAAFLRLAGNNAQARSPSPKRRGSAKRASSRSTPSSGRRRSSGTRSTPARLIKGSPAAKRYMAKLRAMVGRKRKA